MNAKFPDFVIVLPLKFAIMDLKNLPWPKIKKIAIWVGIAIFGTGAVLFALRTPLMKWALNSKVKSFNEAHKADVRVINPHFSGIFTLNFEKIIIKPVDNDTLINIDNLKIKINPLRLITARLSIVRLKADNININVLRDSTGNNYTFLYKTVNKEEPTETVTTNYTRRVDRLMSLFFDILPKDINIGHFGLTLNSKGHKIYATIPKFNINNGDINLDALVTENDSTSTFRMVGKIDTWSNSANIKVFAANASPASIPFISYKYNAKVTFDTLAFGIDNTGYSHGKFKLEGNAMFNGLKILHKKIAQHEVNLEKGSLKYVVNFGKDFVEMDSATVVNFNHLTFSPYAKYRSKPNRFVALSINKDFFPAQDLFSSLPDGIFSSVKGLEVNGELSYHLKFEADWNNLKDLVFESEMKPRNFSIKKYGDVVYPYINSPFTYTFYDNGVPIRTFSVGEDNPNFRSLERIPVFLQYAVMFSEDGNFFGHLGFLTDAFRASLIRNIQAGRFARGGSTITMQLVKNIYLSRNKTIARKMEELLITWMIEHQRLVSKQRMLEIYLNIIEWGPGIFGANEAAEFYFNKDVSQVTPSEAIFMASIIPRPKKFYYSFTDSGSLRQNMTGYYNIIANKLLKRGIISQQDFDGIMPKVNIEGFAKAYLKEPQINLSDTLLRPEDDDPIIVEPNQTPKDN